MTRYTTLLAGAIVLLLGSADGTSAFAQGPSSKKLRTLPFVNVTRSKGLAHDNKTNQTILNAANLPGCTGCMPCEISCGLPNLAPYLCPNAEIMASWLVGGVAVGDIDNDLLVDIFVLGGDAGAPALFHQLPNGTFEDIAAAAGIQLSGYATGAVFVDYDGDRDADLFVGGVVGTMPRLFRNDGSLTFTEVFATAFPGYRSLNTWGAAFGDYDGDGWLDAFLPHSMMPPGPALSCLNMGGANTTEHLWRNNGDGTFTDVSVTENISALFGPGTEFLKDQTFSPNFEDIDGDGDLDILVSGDKSTSLVLENRVDEGLGFIEQTQACTAIRGETAMGTGVGDYDNDGDYDWFISQIGAPFEGNLLFRNDGSGNFTNVTAGSGVRQGHWGWSSTFGDFNNDRRLDIVHVNGMYFADLCALTTCSGTICGSNENPNAAKGLFFGNPACLFMQRRDGTFAERAFSLGLHAVGEGRGVSVFDYDLDGDLDIAVANYNGPFQFFENTLDNRAGFVEVRLRGLAPNTEGIGASVELTSLRQAEGGETLLRGIRAGGNFLSANLAAAHFGLGRWLGPFLVTVHWPGGDHQSVRITQADRFMFFDEIDLDLLTTNLGFHTSEPIVLDASATGIGGVPLNAGIGWFRQGEGVVAMGPTLNEPAGTLAPGNYDMTVFVIDAPTVTFIDFTLAITP